MLFSNRLSHTWYGTIPGAESKSHNLGRPFLATANANINFKIEAMDIFFGDQKVKINIFNASEYTQKEENNSVIDLIDEIVEIDSSFKLIKDDFLDESIEKIQV